MPIARHDVPRNGDVGGPFLRYQHPPRRRAPPRQDAARNARHRARSGRRDPFDGRAARRQQLDVLLPDATAPGRDRRGHGWVTFAGPDRTRRRCAVGVGARDARVGSVTRFARGALRGDGRRRRRRPRQHRDERRMGDRPQRVDADPAVLRRLRTHPRVLLAAGRNDRHAAPSLRLPARRGHRGAMPG